MDTQYKMDSLSSYIKKLNVKNMESPRSNRPVANQFIIETEEATYFQSYSTLIAVKQYGKTFLDKNSWDYSVTTLKYLKEFLGLQMYSKKDLERMIKDGQLWLVNLN